MGGRLGPHSLGCDFRTGITRDPRRCRAGPCDDDGATRPRSTHRGHCGGLGHYFRIPSASRTNGRCIRWRGHDCRDTRSRTSLGWRGGRRYHCNWQSHPSSSVRRRVHYRRLHFRGSHPGPTFRWLRARLREHRRHDQRSSRAAHRWDHPRLGCDERCPQPGTSRRGHGAGHCLDFRCPHASSSGGRHGNRGCHDCGRNLGRRRILPARRRLVPAARGRNRAQTRRLSPNRFPSTLRSLTLSDHAGKNL